MLFFTEKGILKLSLFMGLTEKTLRLGDGLGDDKWHTVKFERRGMIMSLGIDHHRPVIGELFPDFLCVTETIKFKIPGLSFWLLAASSPTDPLPPRAQLYQHFYCRKYRSRNFHQNFCPRNMTYTDQIS